MKKSLFIMAVATWVIVLQGCDYMDALTREDMVITEKEELAPFSEVVIETSVRLELKSSDTYKYEISGQNFVVDRLSIEQQGKAVVISAGGTGFRKKQMATVTLCASSFTRITSNFPAEIVSRDTLRFDHLALVINGRGAFTDSRLILKGGVFSLAAYGSNVGNHIFKGETEVLSVTSEGLTAIDALDLKAGKVHFVQRSVNPGFVFARQQLNVQMEAAGNVYYRGEATVKVNNQPPAYEVKLGKVLKVASP